MKSTKTQFLAVLAVGTVFAFGAQAKNCPHLEPKNVGEAACSTQSNLFRTSALAAVKYYATTPCPSGVGIKKWLQSIFKREKKYLPTEKGLHHGKVTCTYPLTNGDLKTYLGTDKSELVLTADLVSADHANHWSVATFSRRCPDLGKEEVDHLMKHKEIDVIRKKEGGHLTYVFKSNIESSLVQKGLAIAKRWPEGAVIKDGKDALTEAFEVKCEYIYHPEGVETHLELVGTNKDLIK